MYSGAATLDVVEIAFQSGQMLPAVDDVVLRALARAFAPSSAHVWPGFETGGINRSLTRVRWTAGDSFPVHAPRQRPTCRTTHDHAPLETQD